MSTWSCAWCGERTSGSESEAMACHHCGTRFGCKSPTEHTIPKVGVFVPTKGSVKKLFKDHPDLPLRTAESVLADIRAESKAGEKPRVKWVPESERHMLEVDVFDAHVGKLAWHEESGENFDSRIATERVEAAVDDLLSQAKHYPLESIILPWGNDLQQVDNLNGTTTAGTAVDRDSRYQLMYRKTFALSRRVIQRLASVAPVKVIIVPGNHDQLSTFTLGVAIEAYFHADARVSVDNSAKPRKYHKYGTTLLGFAHGHAEPHKRYFSLMPVEEPVLWSQTTQREFHVGHFHKSKVAEPVKVDSENGVRVRILHALSGVDAWHANQGYVGEIAAAEGFVWSYTRGLRANLVSSVQRDAAA